MRTLTSTTLTDEILSLTKEAQGAFPYDECQALAREVGVDYQGLVSSLDTYFYDVWSAGNGVKKLARKTDAWLYELEVFLAQSYFMHYPQYALLQDAIKPQDTPELFRRLKMLDRIKQDVARYVSELLGARLSGTLSA